MVCAYVSYDSWALPLQYKILCAPYNEYHMILTTIGGDIICNFVYEKNPQFHHLGQPLISVGNIASWVIRFSQ